MNAHIRQLPQLAAACALLAALACEDLRDGAPVDPARADAAADARAGGDTRAIDAPSPPDVEAPAGSDAAEPGPTADAGADGPACNPGDTRCAEAGAMVLVCTIEGRWTPKETCPSVCRAGACAGLCAPGQKHCGADQTPETCSPAGEWMPAAQPCTFVCQGEGSCAGDCRPGARRCAGAGQLTPETCDQNGKWREAAPCPNLCSSGSCGGSCRPGIRRCGANRTPETCSPAGTWEAGQACAHVCTGDGQCTGECRPGTRRCTGSGGLVPQSCDDDGRWVSEAACANICTDGVCRGECPPGQRRCRGTVEQLCSGSGAWLDTGSNACRKPNGESCSRDDDCATGFCAELSGGTGICCSSACTGTCESCRGSATGGANGTCAPVRTGTDPDNECAAEGASTCGRDGACDGNRRCRLHPRGTTCEEPKCGTNQRSVLSARSCDGSGACGQATSTACSSIQRCEGSGASARCVSQCDTLGGPCCDGGVCDRAANGRQLYCYSNPSNGATACEHCGRNGERCCTDPAASCETGTRCIRDTVVPTCATCGIRGGPCCPGTGADQPCGDGSICRGPRGICGS